MQSLSTSLTQAPGLFGQLARYIDSTLICSDGAISIPAALSLMSTLKCGRLISDTGIYPNLYTCVVAGSGSGKTNAQNLIEDILKECNLLSLRCGVPTSDSGLCKRLSENNRQLILWDELGVELEALSQSKASFEKRIMKCLMELYSKAGRVYIGKQYATQDRIDVEKPFLNIFGATTGIRFFSSLNDKFLHDGSIARWLFFFPESANPRGTMPKVQIPETLLDWIGTVETWEASNKGNLSSVLGRTEKVLSFDCKATLGLHEQIQKEFAKRINKLGQDSIERVFWNRAFENYIKVLLAMVPNCVADFESVLWASDLVESAITILISKCLEHVKPSDEEATKNRFYQIIAPGEKISKSLLAKKTWRFKLSAAQRRDLIESLIDAELWSFNREKSESGRRIESYTRIR